MMITDIGYDLLAVFHALRLACYLPQIYKIARGTTGAVAASYSSWILWAAANGMTAIYSLTNSGHIMLAWSNGLNALCCTTVIVLIAFKQRQHQRRLQFQL
jgi:hypothetical protein